MSSLMHPLIGLVTIATVFLLIGMMAVVSRARGKYQVKAPATSGPEGFERAFRVQANTNESTLMFLPALWTAAIFMPPYAWLAATFGAIWVVARIFYAITYLDPAKKRTIPFALAGVMVVCLIAMALWGIVWQLLL
jgi:glutathione S-transferase